MKTQLALRLTGLFSAAALGACATVPYASAHHTRVIQSWVGQNAATLWETWGPPSRNLIAPNGSEYHVYFQRPARPAPGTPGLTDPGSATISDPHCETYFVVDRPTQRISAARWRGRCPTSESFTVGPILKLPQPVGF